jgi:hypothetical protein
MMPTTTTSEHMSNSPPSHNSSSENAAPYIPATVLCNISKKSSCSLQQTNGRIISNQWIILDSASSIDMFVNRDLITNIQQSENPVTIVSNADQVTINQWHHARIS